MAMPHRLPATADSLRLAAAARCRRRAGCSPSCAQRASSKAAGRRSRPRGCKTPNPQRYLDPDDSGQGRLLAAAGPRRRRRLHQRPAQEPVPRLLRRVRRSSRVRSRRRPEVPRLAPLRPHRSLLHQAVRRRNEPPLHHPARSLGVDGLRHRQADEVGLLLLPGDLPGVPDAATARRGGAGAVRRRAGLDRAAALPPHAPAAADEGDDRPCPVGHDRRAAEPAGDRPRSEAARPGRRHQRPDRRPGGDAPVAADARDAAATT